MDSSTILVGMSSTIQLVAWAGIGVAISRGPAVGAVIVGVLAWALPLLLTSAGTARTVVAWFDSRALAESSPGAALAAAAVSLIVAVVATEQIERRA